MGDGTERQGYGAYLRAGDELLKCPIGHTYPSCNVACADYIEHMIRNESDVAAIIVEPMLAPWSTGSAAGVHAEAKGNLREVWRVDDCR